MPDSILSAQNPAERSSRIFRNSIASLWIDRKKRRKHSVCNASVFRLGTCSNKSTATRTLRELNRIERILDIFHLRRDIISSIPICFFPCHMKQYAVGRGVDPDDVFLDHAGFSTYESMYRARDVFEVKSAIVVTQKYHLYRSVYNARRLGIDAYGVAADKRVYGKPVYNFVRESLARCKDFFMCIFKPEPTYLGEVIPISGSASLSDDTEY